MTTTVSTTASNAAANADPQTVLFQPVRIGGLDLANRTAVAPMTRTSSSEDGYPVPEMTAYYAEYAKGGFGLVITEGTYTDLSYSQGYVNQPGLASDTQASAWRPIVDAVHQAGGHVFTQLMHGGAQSQGNHFTAKTVGPSAVGPKSEKLALYGGTGAYATPEVLDLAGIKQAIAGFAESAKRAEQAGFDGIEIHGANGYLIDEFLTDYFNQRTDAYGGPIENRVRFAAETVEAVKAAVPSLPVGIRISQLKATDHHHRWQDGERDAAVVFPALRDAGADFIHISDYDAELPAFGGAAGPSFAAVAKAESGLPVIVAGHLEDPAKAARVVASGAADVAAIGRGALADPHWAAHVREGEALVPFTPDVMANGPTLAGVAKWREAHDQGRLTQGAA